MHTLPQLGNGHSDQMMYYMSMAVLARLPPKFVYRPSQKQDQLVEKILLRFLFSY